MQNGREHKYSDAAHFETELCGKAEGFSVRITPSDIDSGSPDYMAGYVPIRLEGPFQTVTETRCALETFLIGIYHSNVSKEHTYRCKWCDDSEPVPNIKRVE
jgi:hypothetical protein